MDTSATFPADFLWAAAAAAYQIEGAWVEDGKGESNWDRRAHTPGFIKNNATGDVAIDHYHRWREDVDLMRQIGLRGYRMSIAWSRVQPDGRGGFNQKGLAFYDQLIDALLAAGIEPLVTLCHYDVPQALVEDGGWKARAMTDWFADYATAMARRYGDRVRRWMTINEPICINDGHVPGSSDPADLAAIAHHLLLGHGKALRAVKAVDAHLEVGLVCNLYPVQPYRGSTTAGQSPELGERVNLGTMAAQQAAALTEENLAWAVRTVDAKINRMFLDPVYKATYPAEYIARMPAPPPIIGDDMAIIGARPDFMGLNYYSRIVVRPAYHDGKLGFEFVGPKELGTPSTTMGWEVYPAGLYEIATRIARDYGDPAIIITENGIAEEDTVSPDGRIHDAYRIEYLRRHIEQMQRCLAAGVKLKGYCVWSLIDNFEWDAGWGQRFGLIHVDYQTLHRRIKDSGYWYRDVIAGHS